MIICKRRIFLILTIIVIIFLMQEVFSLNISGIFQPDSNVLNTSQGNATALDLNSISIIKLSKQTYQPGETFQAEISQEGLLQDLSSDKIKFYKANKTVEVNLFYDFAKISGKYYLYAILPKTERDYDLTIKNVYLNENGEPEQKDIKKTFYVNGNVSPFNFNPGFIIAQNNFYIWLNNNLDSSTELSLSFSNDTKKIILSPKESNKASFSLDNIKETGIYNLKISGNSQSYTIPIYALKSVAINTSNNVNYTDNNFITKNISLKFSPSYINATIKKNDNVLFNLRLLNPSQTDAKNLSFSYPTTLKGVIQIKPEKIPLLEGGKFTLINLSFVSANTGFFDGNISIILNSAENNYLLANLKIGITVFESKKNLTSSSSLVGEQKCANIGKSCSYDETCTADTIFTVDGPCCIGFCEKEKKRGTNWTIIILAVILLAIVGFILYRAKFKKKTPEDVIKEREKKYTEKFEAKGGLERV